MRENQMATARSDLVDKIAEQARRLPAESLRDLATYLEFLQFKATGREQTQPLTHGDLLAKLDGILAGYDFSPEMVAAARREMWRGFGEAEL